MIGSLDKNLSIGPDNGQLLPECKKIQDYIYRFADNIGTGNFSKVFKGFHQVTNKQVAIKIIQLSSLKNNRLQELLNTQTKILKMLNHPNVIGCEQILSSIRNCYIITQLCNSGDLQKKLKKVGHFKQKQIYQIAVDIYQGLKYLSKKHIIHRDIKTSNIFINNEVYKIADFGFAQISQIDFKDISVGSPVYMSPQGYINNTYGPKTDIWAFGVLLYELVQGKTPYYDCRSENDLKQLLMKQLDYSNFSSNISNQLKNLIIQCMEINPSLRIRTLDIENTPWMKKAYKFVNQNHRVSEKQNHNHDKPNNMTSLYRKISQQLPIKATQRPQTPSSPISQDPKFKNYLQKLHILQKVNANTFVDIDYKRKHSTLQKTNKITKDDSQQKANDSGKIFYSPKNTILKFQKALCLKQLNISKKFDQTNLKNNTSPDHNKLNSTKPECHRNYQNNKIDGKNKVTWIDYTKQGRAIQQKIDKYSNLKQKQKCKINQNNILFQNKDEKYVKNTQKLSNAMTDDIKNYLTINSPNNGLSSFENHQKTASKGSREQKKNKQRFSQFIELKPTQQQVQRQKQVYQKKKDSQITQQTKNSTLTEQKYEKKSAKNNQIFKVLNRKLKFGDCIGLIHYCRLCYKFACLIDEEGDSEDAKKFLASWSVQLLLELNSKIDEGQILFSNQNCLINNLSISPGQLQKKKKLRDVTQQYLNKYASGVKSQEKTSISLKQASNFIYNIYLSKIHKFKEKTKDKKSYIYFALISYLSVLDKETRNLIQFVYQIRNSMEGRKIQKILNIKISEFNKKIIEQLTNEVKEKQLQHDE